MAAPKIDQKDLLSLQEYRNRHQEIRAEMIQVRELRRVEVGPWASFSFENRQTVLYQIQEMIRVEHLTGPAKIQEEISAYDDLLPSSDELSATLFIEISDAQTREKALTQLGGIETTISLKIGGLNAPARDKRPIDPRFARPGRASAVYYLGFPLDDEMKQRFLEAAQVRLEISHPHYGHCALISPETLAALRQDLREI